MRRIAGFVHGSKAGTARRDPPGEGTCSMKLQLGLMAKRLIDEGRVAFLRAHGWTTRLVSYVGKDVTPENCLLLAVAPGG